MPGDPSDPGRERLVLDPLADDPELGRWLAAMEDGRRETLRELDTVRPEMVDWRPDAPLNSIGTLLYHIDLVEACWAIVDVSVPGSTTWRPSANATVGTAISAASINVAILRTVFIRRPPLRDERSRRSNSDTVVTYDEAARVFYP